ncbi:MAG: hypothetical protein EP332_01055 [Bacteroidetes bacterium]|nr:MAG: hypothetical protein EP332_01055 [Bacteroidota bacterium]
MHELEPYYRWRDLYIASEDENSPFFEREYSEFEFTNKIYDHVIHPQWDEFGSQTLYLKVLFADYDDGYAIIEMIGEWNDAIDNDIMFLKRDILEHMMDYGINKFILIGENVLNFHGSDDSYYEELYSELEDEGWVAMLNFRQHVLREIRDQNLDYYVHFGGELDDIYWRKLQPPQLFTVVQKVLSHRLG